MLLHALIPASRVNGPGFRAVLFFQGCSLGCHGCWNPQSHGVEGPVETSETVVNKILRAHAEFSLEGVTFSGGEPMQQADSLLALVQDLRRQAPELSFGMFSGYTERELDEGRYRIWHREFKVREKRRLALSRIAIMKEQKRLDEGLVESYFWNADAEYFSPWLAEEEKVVDTLAETLDRLPAVAGEWMEAPVEFSIPDSLKADVECCQMVVREAGISFVAIPKHTSSYVFTAEIPLPLLESVAAA